MSLLTRKAFWPLVAVLGVLLAFGAISGGKFQADLAEADISFDGDTANVWFFFDLDDFDGGDCDDEDQLVAGITDDTAELDTDDVIFLFTEGGDRVWICVNLDDFPDDDLEFDSDDYGTWEEVLCALQDGDPDFSSGDDECDDVIGLGTDQIIIQCDDQSECDEEELTEGDVAALFVCEDDKAGEATVTISQDNEVQFRIICFNEADGLDGKMTCLPCTVEIVPALGSVQYSLIYVKLLDEDDNASAPFREVTWTTDNCEVSDDSFAAVFTETGFEDEDLDTFDEIVDLFEQYVDAPTPGNADDINDFVDDIFDPDWDDEGEDFTFLEEPFDTNDPFEDMDTFAAVILNCGQGHDSSPGVAEVCAIIEVRNDPDIVECIDVTVVGGPATVTAVPDVTSVRCGERVQVTVTVKDAKGANVSDHTLVEAITNFGGVLGGTGAVAGQQGLVVPVSSTLAETIKGVATFYLLTSETHSGPYEIIITTGGGGAVAGLQGDDEDENGGDEDEDDDADERIDFDEDDPGSTLGGLFSTGVINARVQVSCTIPAQAAPAAPAPAPTIRAPSTGQGATITPPSTGDGGLADASGASWALFVIGGMAAFAIAGAVSLKLARR